MKQRNCMLCLADSQAKKGENCLLAQTSQNPQVLDKSAFLRTKKAMTQIRAFRADKKVPFLPIFLFTIVWKYVNMFACLPAGKRKPPAGDGYSGEPQVVSHRVART
jgi:hypothetical protein